MHVAVVGAGLIGLLTAVRCVEAGHRVTVVEQDTIPSPRATSFDRHRILRALHPGDGAATVEAARARRLWIELQGLLSSRFVVPVGALTVLPAGAGDRAGGGLALLHRAGERAEAVDRGRLARDWPHLSFRHLAGDADRAAAPA
ncbi:MAG TPA: FAD-dependent oxidoreductase, partial [Pseudonocardia sp.]|nr:FAD-dependent oxidoreductase [Pseudonocardia sp.]